MGICFSRSSPQTADQISINHQPRITTEYDSLSEVNDHRIDAFVGSRHGQVIHVSTRTFEVMRQAHEVLQEVGYRTFPDGPGNQEEAILVSKGLSNGRALKLRTTNQETGFLNPRYVSAIKRLGGGNCGEYTRVATMELFSRGNTVPIFNIYEPNIGHAAVVMGDWRDRTVGDHAVVVDAWQGLKKIYTYGERVNTITPDIDYQLPPASSMPPANVDIREALATTPVPKSQIINYMRSSSMVGYGREGAIAKILALREHNLAWNSITGANSIYTAYRSQDGDQSEFSSTPKQYLKDYLRAREQLNSL